MEPADQGGDNPHQDDDTSMGGGVGGGGTATNPSGGGAARDPASTIKFTYNLLHYPRYPSYEVLLEKRFKTLPLASTSTSELEASSSASSSRSQTLGGGEGAGNHHYQQNSSSASIEGAHEGDQATTMCVEGREGGEGEGDGGASPLHRPSKRKRDYLDLDVDASSSMPQSREECKDHDPDQDGEESTAEKARPRRKRPKPDRDPAQSQDDDDDVDDGGGAGGRSPLLTTTRSSSSMELPSVVDAGGAGCRLPLLLGMNGIEPEDRPAEDDCEAEPTQSVEDEHCRPAGAVPVERGAMGSDTVASSSSTSSSSFAPALDAIASGGPKTLSSTVACVRRDGMTRDEMKANAVSLDELIEPLADIRRSTQEMGRSLRNHRFHYNLDLCKLVTGIDRSVTELNAQILSRRRFLEFVLHLDRPVQTNLGYFGALPIELVLHIFGYLDGKDLLRNADVCSTFAALSNDAHLWKNIVERTWDLEGTYMQKPSHKSFKWLFECKKRVFKAGDTKNGKGSWDGEHGDMYEGEWKDNKRHGVGTGLMQDGRRYDGEWENDMRSGFGIFRWPVNYAKNGGDLYAGNWKEDQRHGEGIYIWADGTKYEGQWKEGKREGFGCVVWPDGRRYEGEYKDGKMSGKGTFCWPDGSVYVGEYKDGKRHGEGTYTYSTMMGGVYTGQWRNGMRDGWGKLVKNDGEMYQGVWKFNCPFGGVLTRKDGTVIEKFWRLFSPDS